MPRAAGVGVLPLIPPSPRTPLAPLSDLLPDFLYAVRAPRSAHPGRRRKNPAAQAVLKLGCRLRPERRNKA